MIATKGASDGHRANDGGLSRRHLRIALDASLRRLGVEAVDLYQLHAFDPHTPLLETLQFLDEAVRAGKIAYVGFRTSPAGKSRRPSISPNFTASPDR